SSQSQLTASPVSSSAKEDLHAQVRELLCQLRGKVWPCQLPALGSALLPQGVQACLCCKDGERARADAQVVWFVGARAQSGQARLTCLVNRPRDVAPYPGRVTARC